MNKIENAYKIFKECIHNAAVIANKVGEVISYVVSIPSRIWQRIDRFMFKHGPKLQLPIFIGALGYGGYLTYFA